MQLSPAYHTYTEPEPSKHGIVGCFYLKFMTKNILYKAQGPFMPPQTISWMTCLSFLLQSFKAFFQNSQLKTLFLKKSRQPEEPLQTPTTQFTNSLAFVSRYTLYVSIKQPLLILLKNNTALFSFSHFSSHVCYYIIYLLYIIFLQQTITCVRMGSLSITEMKFFKFIKFIIDQQNCYQKKKNLVFTELDRVNKNIFK